MRKHDTRCVALKRALDEHPVTPVDRSDPAADADRFSSQPPFAIERQFHQDLAAETAELYYQCFEKLARKRADPAVSRDQSCQERSLPSRRCRQRCRIVPKIKASSAKPVGVPRITA